MNQFLSRISVLVRNKNAFLAVIVVVSALKLLFSAIAPASFDLRDIITYVGVNHGPIGPWITLYPLLYNQTAANSEQLKVWLITAPPSMTLQLQTTSLMFRLPIFALDILTALPLYYVGKRIASPAEGRIASLIWFANPYSLLSIELLGVPDILPTLLSMVALLLLIEHRYMIAGATLALGVWVKFYPILLVPPILWYMHTQGVSRRNIGIVSCLGVVGLAAYLLWTLPAGLFYLTSYTPVTQYIPFISGQLVNVATFVMLLFYCLLGLFAVKAKNLLVLLLPTLLVYYAASSLYYMQYLVWVMPLMALDIALVKRSRAWLFLILNVLGFAQWFFLSSAFLTPSSYSLLMIPLGGTSLPWYSQAAIGLLESYSVTLLLPLVSSTFFACVLIYAADTARSWFTSDVVPGEHN